MQTRLPKDSVESISIKAFALSQLNYHLEAEKTLKTALRLLGKTTEGRPAAVYYGVRAALLQDADPDKAATLFQLANEAQPDSPASCALPYLLQIKWLVDLAQKPENEDSITGAYNLIEFLRTSRHLNAAEERAIDNFRMFLPPEASGPNPNDP